MHSLRGQHDDDFFFFLYISNGINGGNVSHIVYIVI